VELEESFRKVEFHPVEPKWLVEETFSQSTPRARDVHKDTQVIARLTEDTVSKVVNMKEIYSYIYIGIGKENLTRSRPLVARGLRQ
jgi:hypothetical protein